MFSFEEEDMIIADDLENFTHIVDPKLLSKRDHNEIKNFTIQPVRPKQFPNEEENLKNIIKNNLFLFLKKFLFAFEKRFFFFIIIQVNV